MTARSPLKHVSTADRPFGLPAEIAPIVLDLPVPPSVNKTRDVSYRGMPAKCRWLDLADKLVMSKGRLPPAIIGPWTMVVTMSEDMWRIDPDNGLKELVDFCRRLELIENDSPRFARRIILEWGEAPEGARVTIRSAA